MPRKLPADLLPKLSAILAAGKLPGWGEPGHEIVDEIWGDALEDIVQDAWKKPKASLSRRSISALWEFWGNICMDGLTVGVAINEPALIAAAHDAAAAMKLKKVAGILAKVAACIPPEVQKLKSLDKRIAWYQSAKGAPVAAKLEKLEERINEPDFSEDVQKAIFRRLVAEPEEFFERQR